MPKSKTGSLGRKVKMSQPVAIPWDLAIALVAAKVVKGPAVPKMEVMEKWIVGGGRDLEIAHDRDAGTTVATLICPSPDGQVRYVGTDVTMALATANAIHEYCKAQPLPDPTGADLPLFRGNGGVASVAEMGLDEEPAGSFVDLDSIVQEAAREMNAAVAAMPDALPPVREWTWLHIINPSDAKRWKKEAPAFEGAPVVEFEEGDDSNERGWYLDPDFFYDREMGFISQRNPIPGQAAMVWSRDVETKPGVVEATKVNLVTASAD